MKKTIFCLSIVLINVQCIFAQNKNDGIKWQGASTGGDTVEGIVWMQPVQLSPDSDIYAWGPNIAVQGDTVYVTWSGTKLNFPFRRSVDGGRTFEPLREIGPRDSLDRASGCFLVSSNKTLHAFFVPQNSSAMYTMHSNNGGDNWSPIIALKHNMAFGSFGVHGDTVVIMNNCIAPIIYTTDGGESWNKSSPVWAYAPQITFANGIVHLVRGPGYLIPGLPEFVIQYARSTDFGNTWMDSFFLNADPPGSDQACIATDPDANPATLISVWRDGKYGCTTDLGCSQVGRLSYDGGTTWQPSRRFDIIPAGFGTVARIRDSIIAVMWDQEIFWYVNAPPAITISTDKGQSWTTPCALTSLDTSCSSRPSPIALSNGVVHTSFYNGRIVNESDKWRIFYRRGIILSAQRPRFSISKKNLSFEQTKVLCSTIIPVVVKNTGGATLNIQSVLSDDSNFTVTPSNGTIHSYDSLIFNVSFTPKSSDVKSGKVIFSHNAQSASGGSPDTVNVSGIGTTSGIMSVNPRNLSLGETSVSCRTLIPITVKNTRCASIDVQSFVLDDSCFSVAPINAAINPSDSVTFIVMFQPISAGVKSARIIFTHNVEGSPDTISVTGTGTGSSATAVITNYYGTDWQMISLPVKMLCPYTASNLFTYSSRYEQKDTMVEGAGYWQKLNTATLRFVGYSITDDTLQVKIGWNMIGSISSPFAVNEIRSLPGGLTISNVFGYNGTNYFVSDTIYPGRGYWVKVSEDASLILSALEEISFQKEILSVNSQIASRVNIVRIDELPPPPPTSPPKADTPPVQTIPKELGLEQNYPNPFNPRTDVRYAICDVSHVSLKVYDLLGREVATLVDEVKQPGYYTVKWNASGVPSGVYLYRLTTGDHIETKKLVLMR